MFALSLFFSFSFIFFCLLFSFLLSLSRLIIFRSVPFNFFLCVTCLRDTSHVRKRHAMQRDTCSHYSKIRSPVVRASISIRSFFPSRGISLFLEGNEERRAHRRKFLLVCPQRLPRDEIIGSRALLCRIRLKYLNKGSILCRVFCPIICGIAYASVINYAVYHKLLLLLKLHLSGIWD